MYIVLDSNIWIRELGLNSSKGAAVRFFIKNQDAILALPEVIKLEAKNNLRSKLELFPNNKMKNFEHRFTQMHTDKRKKSVFIRVNLCPISY